MAKVVGKYKIEVAYGTLFQFSLYANNGQLLFESIPYTSLKTCRSAIETFQTKIADDSTKLRIDEDKNHNFKYIFKNGNNIYTGETYAKESAAESAANSVISFASSTTIVEDPEVLTVKDLPADTDNSSKNTAPATSLKVAGKYVIQSTKFNNDGDDMIFQFILYANNGQLLFESREYASAATCKSGIETFKKNIQQGDLFIDKDKKKKWRFIVRKGISLYLGESFDDKDAAVKNAESVKKFAIVSELVK